MDKDLGADPAFVASATEPVSRLGLPASIRALAERCEQATEANRELDGSIWWATRRAEDIERIDRSGFIRRCIERDGSAGIALAQFYDSANPACLAIVAFRQAYTSSFDAAMALVPDGWQLKHLSELDDQGGWQCQLVAPYDWSPRPFILADWCATPALALCTAALRARAIEAQRAETSSGSVGDEGASA